MTEIEEGVILTLSGFFNVFDRISDSLLGGV